MMATYEQADFRQIAAAVGISIDQVVRHESQFEAAARWYRLGKRRPAHIAPSKLVEKLGRVGNNARRLLNSLGIKTPEEASDGPGDIEILDARVLSADPTEDLVLEATRRIGRLVEIVDTTAAAAELHPMYLTNDLERLDGRSPPPPSVSSANTCA